MHALNIFQVYSTIHAYEPCSVYIYIFIHYVLYIYICKHGTVTCRKSCWNLGWRKTKLLCGCSNTHVPPLAMIRYIARIVLAVAVRESGEGKWGYKTGAERMLDDSLDYSPGSQQVGKGNTRGICISKWKEVVPICWASWYRNPCRTYQTKGYHKVPVALHDCGQKQPWQLEEVV